MQTQQLINIQDAAVVSWEQGKKKPKTRQLNNLAGAGALGGAFWGMLFGLIFFVPLLGLAVGAAMGALTGSMADVGIDDKFINGVKQRVTPGTSALFLLTSDAVVDRVEGCLRRHQRRADRQQPLGRAGSQVARGLRRGVTVAGRRARDRSRPVTSDGGARTERPGAAAGVRSLGSAATTSSPSWSAG